MKYAVSALAESDASNAAASSVAMSAWRLASPVRTSTCDCWCSMRRRTALRSRSLACRRPTASEIVRSRSGGGQGFVRNRKIWPSFTAAIAEVRSAWPVSRMRCAPGAMASVRARNSAPFMPGMRMSDTMMSTDGSSCSNASAAAPPSAVRTSYSLARCSCSPRRTSGSSSTHRIRMLLELMRVVVPLAPCPAIRSVARRSADACGSARRRPRAAGRRVVARDR